MDDITRRSPQGQSGRHQSAFQLGSPSACPRHDGRRFRGARRLPAPAQVSHRPRPPGARKLRTGRALTFDVNNIRYITSTKIGEWERDKLSRCALLRATGEPILWDFGSAAVHHRLYCAVARAGEHEGGPASACAAPCIRLRADGASRRGDHGLLKEAGVEKMPIGIDIIEPAMMFELQKAGLKIVDGQQIMLEAREIKNIDEIALLNQAAAMVDGAYHLIWEELRPGVRENDIVAEVNKLLYKHGSDDVEAINAISGERCNPHPHNFTDRHDPPRRPGVLRHPAVVHGLPHLLLPHLQRRPRDDAQHDAYKQAANGSTTQSRSSSRAHRPRRSAQSSHGGANSDFPTRCRPSACNSAHGLGLALHERPIISRVVSLDHPTEIKEGMVFAIETYCPATDGYSAARIEEEVVVTDKGCRVISLFPAEELPIANAY